MDQKGVVSGPSHTAGWSLFRESSEVVFQSPHFTEGEAEAQKGRRARKRQSWHSSPAACLVPLRCL